MRRGTIGGVVAVKKVANMQEHSVINVDWAVAVNIGGAIFRAENRIQKERE